MVVSEPQGSSQLLHLMGTEVLLALKLLMQGLLLLLGESCVALGLLNCPRIIFSAILRPSGRLRGSGC